MDFGASPCDRHGASRSHFQAFSSVIEQIVILETGGGLAFQCRPMQLSPTVLSQITGVLYPEEFSRCVRRFPTPRPTRGLTEYDQFLAFCFGQLTYRESLRDIVACLRARPSLLYHLGFR